MVLVVQKASVDVRLRVFEEQERLARNALNEFLFADLPEVDPVEKPEAYQRFLQPPLTRLRTAALGTGRGARQRRDALRSVMLDLSLNITGETRHRLTAAFDRLGFVGEEIAATASRKWWIRARACRRLRLMQAESAAEQLVGRLNDVNDDVRVEAAQSLVDIVGVDALSPILLTLKDMSLWMEIRLARSVLRFGSDAVPHLSKGLRSESTRVQRFCMELMGDIGDVYAVPVILEYIGYDVPEVRLAGIVALGKLGDARAIPVIISYAQSEDERVRLAAAKALGNLSSPATADVLNRMLLKDTIDIRLAAAESLTRLGDIGIRTLQYSTRSDDRQTRLAAFQYLHELGYPVPAEEIP